MTPGIFGSIKVGKKVFLKAFSKDIFREFISSYQITGTDTVLEDFINIQEDITTTQHYHSKLYRQ